MRWAMTCILILGKPAVQALAAQVAKEFAGKYSPDMILLKNAYYPDVVVKDDVTFQNSGMQEYTAFHQKQALALVQSCVQALHAASDADIGVMVPDNASSMEAVNGVSLSQICSWESTALPLLCKPRCKQAVWIIPTGFNILP